MTLQNVLFKQSAKDCMQYALFCVRCMNIYDLVFSKIKPGKVNQKLIKMLPCGRVSGKGVGGTGGSCELSFSQFRPLETFYVFKKWKCRRNEHSKALL